MCELSPAFQVGFDQVIDISGVPGCTHLVEIVATDSDGNMQTIANAVVYRSTPSPPPPPSSPPPPPPPSSPPPPPPPLSSPPPPPPTPVNCITSSWSSWGACSKSCDGGTQTRSRSIVQQPSGGGLGCGALTQSKSCNTAPCGKTGSIESRELVNCALSLSLSLSSLSICLWFGFLISTPWIRLQSKLDTLTLIKGLALRRSRAVAESAYFQAPIDYSRRY